MKEIEDAEAPPDYSWISTEEITDSGGWLDWFFIPGLLLIGAGIGFLINHIVGAGL